MCVRSHRSAVQMTLAALSSLPVAAGAAAAAPAIPLCPGLTIVTAVSEQGGDYESIKTITEVTPAQVRLKYSAEIKNSDLLGNGPAVKKIELQRSMLTADLESATSYQQLYFTNSADTIPGTTGIGTSADVLRALKSGGETKFAISIGYDGLELTADRAKSPNYYSYLEQGTIKRVNGPATLPVLVNDTLVDLPVVRAEGDLVSDKVQFDFLDDPHNPLTLAFRIGVAAIKPLSPEWAQLCATITKTGQLPGALPGGTRCDRPNGGDRDALRVVKISFRCPVPGPANAQTPQAGGAGAGAGAGGGAGGGSRLEQQLAAQQKADVYSIYFSFNSDAIRPESEPTLQEIADILHRHPDWRLAVNGHTDGVGADQYNLALSNRRAAAVVAALTTRYAIDPKRLQYAGYGKSQPKDTNDTLEGRARNRRVELMRF